MNAALILSGGHGQRFESELPKQYHRLNGKMVIEYVIDAALSAKSIDRVVIACARPCPPLEKADITRRAILIEGGAARNETLKKGLTYLAGQGCDKLIVLDAVRPLVTGHLIDTYMGFLAEGYHAVSTAQRITDSLGCFDLHAVDRGRYYLMQSPEAFDFPLLYHHFDSASALTEVVQQLPPDSRVKLYFDFPNNPKLTYPWEKEILERMLAFEDK